jgi:hypothetical protein
MERNLHDCLGVAKNIFCDPRLLPGGGSVEMEISARINDIASQYEGIEQIPFRAGNYFVLFQLVTQLKSFQRLWLQIVESMSSESSQN